MGRGEGKGYTRLRRKEGDMRDALLTYDLRLTLVTTGIGRVCDRC